MKQLHYLSSLNREKILAKNAFSFLFALMTALSFYNLSSVMGGYVEMGRYDIADGTEYRLLYTEERLTGRKVSETAEKYAALDLPADLGRVATADLRLVRMIAQVYGWNLGVPAGALSDERFYADRATAIAALGAGGQAALPGLGAASPEATTGLDSAYPLKLGYAEGWRNITTGLRDCAQIVLLIVFLVLVPMFNEDRTLGVENMVRSTKLGNRKLDRIRIVNALQLSALLYAAAVGLYIIPVAVVYGLDGAALPIQGDPLYFLSPAGLSFLGQFAVNLLIGAIAVAGMAGISLLVSVIVTDTFTGYATLLFIAALSYLVDMFDLPGFKHFLWNFSPIGMVNFNAYYIGYETYFGVPSILFVPLTSAAIAGGEYLLLSLLLREKTRSKKGDFSP
jgi:hypothetical protein